MLRCQILVSEQICNLIDRWKAYIIMEGDFLLTGWIL